MRAIHALATAAALIPMTAGPAASQDKILETGSGARLKVEVFADGLSNPWGIAFLPDGRALVTERPGRLRIADKSGKLSEPVKGVPKVYAERQGGLLDVALHPDFESNGWVYLTYAEAGEGGASTAAGRGRLKDGALVEFERIFQQQPKVSGGAHFGSRLVFTSDGHLFITLGERFKFDPAQDLSSHLGTIVRVRDDGTAPSDNPFVDHKGARPEIWSYGHRNVQGGAIHPQTGEFWSHEMGPQGGDELNVIERGRNYGWPVVSWGEHYDGRDIPDPPTRPEFTDAVRHWTPVISPSGMTFYTGNAFSRWRDSILIGGLSSEGVVRVRVDGRKVVEEERIPLGARIRDVEVGPDGAVYALTDEDKGKILRLSPAD